MNADKKYVEIPFQRPVRDETHDSVEIIFRGVIDLVFLENSGWVIVDYKTEPVRRHSGLSCGTLPASNQ